MSSHSSLILASSVVLLSIGAFLIALALIFFSGLLEKREGEAWKPVFKKLGGHLMRDIAIAFFVALMVTGLYEGYVKEKLQLQKTARDFTEILQSHAPDGVWTELNNNVINTPRIRRNVEIVFRIQKDEKLLPSRALLWMSYSYDLYGLGHNSTSYRIRHDVDEHFFDKDYPYPRFERATVVEPQPDGNINKQDYDGVRLDRENKRQSFQQDVSLQPSYDYDVRKYDDSKAVKVTTQRYEVIELPGIYPLGIPELIEGPIKVYFIIPDEMKVTPSVHTQWAGHIFTHVGKRKFTSEGQEAIGDLWTCEGILLPGQTFLMYFKELIQPSSPSSDQVNPS